MKHLLTVFATLAVACSLFAQKPRPAQDKEIRLDQDEKIFTKLEDNSRIDLATGHPVALYGLNIQTEGNTSIEKARNYLVKHGVRLGLLQSDLSDLVHHATRSGDAGEVVRFRQYYKGYPVNKAEITISISPNNLVTMVQSSYQSQVKLENINQVLSEEEAIQIANTYISPTRLMKETTLRTMIYHNQKMTRLAHEVIILAGEPLGQWHVFVDATDGQIFKVIDGLHYNCNKDNHGESCGHTTNSNAPGIAGGKSMMAVVDGTGLVFDPDPLSSNTVAYGGNYADNNDATNADLDAARISVTLREIEETAGVYKLLGPWAEISDHDAPTTGLFTQNSSTFDFNRNDQAFEAVSCYYHVDSLMRYINVTLNVTAVPYQYTGGVLFDPHGAGGADNSFYSSGAGTITFGEGCVDDAEDSDVIHHELGHFLHDMVTNGGLSQNEGLSEGCGDYIAQSYNRSLGFWTPADAAYNWVFNWDGHNECWAGRVTNNPSLYPDGLGGGLHANGTLWSTCMMKVWDELGRDLTDKIFYEGLGMTNGSSNQNDAAVAVYNAAVNLNYSSTDIQTVHAVLTACGYTLPALDGPPIVDISADKTVICLDVENTINFTDQSTSSPGATGWLWTFEGGTPATSTDPNPVVDYAAEGAFDVSLEVTNVNGTTNMDFPDYITTLAGTNCPNCASGTSTTVVPISESGSNIVYTSIINIPNTGTVTEVNVTNISGDHTYLGDLTFSLISPDNTTVQLNEDVCGSDENFNVGFDDEATSSTLPCPYTDGMMYIPFQALSAFIGEPANGDWTLSILDDANADGGQLNSWTIEVCIAEDITPPNCDENLMVEGDIRSGTYNAWNLLSTNGLVKMDSMVIFQSQTTIDLLDGFEVQLNADFTGEIADCPD